MAIADLHQLRTNARNQVNRMLDNITGKRTRIGILLQEKFALQLLYQRNAHHLQNSHQNILNLQGQILALQNNSPNLINMTLPAGFVMPELSSFKQDHEKYVDDFIAYINLANINNEARIHNIL